MRSKCDLELPNHLPGAISGHQSLYSGTKVFFSLADPGFPVGRLLSRYGAVKVPLMLRTALRMGTISTIFTAHERSLGQGNVFTPVYHSVHGGGGWLPSMYHRSHDQGDLPPGESASEGV